MIFPPNASGVSNTWKIAYLNCFRIGSCAIAYSNCPRVPIVVRGSISSWSRFTYYRRTMPALSWFRNRSRRNLWRLVVPVAVERNIPIQSPEKLYVISNCRIRVYPARLGERREDVAINRQIRFVEGEKLRLSGNQGCGNVLRPLLAQRLGIPCVLPSQAAQHPNVRPVCILQISSEAATKIGPKIDSLFGALKEVRDSRVKPIVPAKQSSHKEVERVSCRNRRTSAGGQRRVVTTAGHLSFGWILQ